MKKRIEDAISVLFGKKMAIDKDTSIYEIVGWKYGIVRPSYKEMICPTCKKFINVHWATCSPR